jgi:hypothetical protein
MNQYFLKDHCMLQNHAGVKDPFEVKARPVGFSVTQKGH